jgi:hypothetical protein
MVRTLDDRGIPLATAPNSWLLAEVTKTRPEGLIFRRERGPLWNIARRHYFDVVLKPLRPQQQASFESGWHAPEISGMDQMRWMEKRSVTVLPPASGEVLLRLLFHLPENLVGTRFTITLNGTTLEAMTLDRTEIARDYEITPATANQPNRLEMSADRTVEQDGQQISIRLRYLSWGPASRESWQRE